MTLPVVFTANGPSGYNLTKSLRFRSSASAYLNRTATTPTNGQKFTLSFWLKRGTLTTSSAQWFFTGGATSNVSLIGFPANSDTLAVYQTDSVGQGQVTSAVLRDPSAWYSIIIAVDTTQASNTDRIKIYINNVQQATSVSGTVTQNSTWGLNSANVLNIGRYGSGVNSNYLDGYLAEINFIDGQALTPFSFGSTNALTGVWQPAKYTGTYGTNGYYLPFTNTTSTTTLGYDFSGNSNNWTTNNLSLTTGSTYDSMTDVPTLTSATTANYCVMNPLNSYSTITVNNANLQLTLTQAAYRKSVATMAFPSSGLYYLEGTVSGGIDYVSYGIVTPTAPLDDAVGNTATGYGVITGTTNWDKKNNGTTSGNFWTISTSSPTLQIAYNATSGKLWLGYNNTWLDGSGGVTGNPSAGTNETFTVDTTRTYLPSFGGYKSNSIVINLNFGQRAFTYTPPTGFVALNTYNLPTSTIVKGNTVMDATTYTGNLIGQAITNTASFKPDLVWVKSRSAATDNKLTDSNRGATLALISNSTGAQTTDLTGVVSFNTNGFTLGTSTTYNNTGNTYVGWQWQAGQGTNTTNTAGSITSTVSVNASAGFSVVTYTGTGSNATVGHGLGVAPSMVIVKSRSDASTYWCVYQSAMWATSGTDYTLLLPLTNAAASRPTLFNSTQPTSSVFSIGTNGGVNNSSSTYVAYCWAEIAGFSKFGSYTGNGSTDGPFVYTGFRPKFVLIKNAGATGGDWCILDTSRNTYNLANADLFPNDSRLEGQLGFYIDILSNGFKLRTSDTFSNASGQTVIYAAFAENPFKNALAR